MADNTTLNAGTGGDVIASDDIGGVKHQRVKISVGADGSATDVSSAAPMPVSLAAETTKVIGTVNISAAQTVATVTTVGAVTAITNALPAGTNAIGKLAANSGVDIGDVDVTTVGTITPGTAATSLGKAEDAAHTTGDVGVMALAVRNDAGTALAGTTGDYIPLSTDANGALRVSGASGTTQYTEDAASAGGESLCLMGAVRRDTAASSSGTDGDYSTLNTDATGNLRVAVSAGGIAGVVNDAAITVGTTEGVLTMGRASTATPSAVSADNDAVHAWLTRTGATVVDGAIVDDAAFTPGTSRVQPIAFQADESSTDSVDEGDAGCPRMTLDRKVIVTPYAHAAAGGATPYFNLDCDESEDDIKTSPGKLFWIHAINLSATKKYLKFYNATAANVTVGTTTPVLSFPIPTMADTNGAGFTINFGAMGVQFDTAISVAATTGFANNDTGAPGTNEVILNAGYL